MTKETHIKIGTRGSKLALIQANMVADALREAHPELQEDGAVELVIITTSGDRIQDRSLLEAGGKGLFIKEIEEALFAGEIDLAVHSMKDVPAFLPEQAEMGCIFPREEPWDAFLSPHYASLQDLPEGATLGTSGVRRKALALAVRPDLNVVLFRGNVDTRLRKLEDGVADATFLAVAGLNRMGLSDEITKTLSMDDMLPAAGQGAVGVEIRKDDQRLRNYLNPLHCHETAAAVAAERAFIAVLDGSCRTPIAAYAVFDEAKENLEMTSLVAMENGEKVWKLSDRLQVSPADAEKAVSLGKALGQKMKDLIPADVLQQLMEHD